MHAGRREAHLGLPVVGGWWTHRLTVNMFPRITALRRACSSSPPLALEPGVSKPELRSLLCSMPDEL